MCLFSLLFSKYFESVFPAQFVPWKLTRFDKLDKKLRVTVIFMTGPHHHSRVTAPAVPVGLPRSRYSPGQGLYISKLCSEGEVGGGVGIVRFVVL